MSTSTTTNYGWTIPNDDELVKNGAAAIRTLGQAIDTTAAASFSAGLVLLDSISFSAVTSVATANNTFDATYDHYKILCKGTCTATTLIYQRYSAAGSGLVATNYYWSFDKVRTTGVSVLSGAGAVDYGVSLDVSATGGFRFSSEIMSPFLAEPTSTFTSGTATDGVGTYRGDIFNTYLSNTQIDATYFYVTSGTISGQLEVYGVKK